MEAAALENPRYIAASLRHFVSDAVVETELPAEWTAETATREIAHALGLPATGTDGHPQAYELFVRHHDGTGEALRPTIRIGDALRADGEAKPELTVLPEVTPG